MNCRHIEPLLLAERDGALSAGQRDALDQHVAACPACRQMRANLAAALASFRADAASVNVPDAAEEWRVLRAELHGEKARPARKRPLAPIIWFSAPLAAAAACALAYFGFQPNLAGPTDPAAGIAQTDPGDTTADASASTMVYVDKDSGWLVVWATDSDAANSG